MTFGEAVHAFFDTPIGGASQGVLAVAAIDAVLGIMAAVRDDRFTWHIVGEFLRKNVAGWVIPIWTLLFIGWLGDLAAVVAGGLAVAAAYIARTIAAIFAVWGPGRTNGGDV